MSDNQDFSHIPPHLIYLAQQIARDCAEPGVYSIKLSVPAHAASAFAIEIGKYEKMRKVSFGRKRGRGTDQQLTQN